MIELKEFIFVNKCREPDGVVSCLSSPGSQTHTPDAHFYLRCVDFAFQPGREKNAEITNFHILIKFMSAFSVFSYVQPVYQLKRFRWSQITLEFNKINVSTMYLSFVFYCEQAFSQYFFM